MAQEFLDPVKAATTENIDLALGVIQDSTESTIDGKKVVVGDRILVKSQTDKTENGIYVVSNSLIPDTTRNALERSSDFLANSFHTSSVVFVVTGNLLANTGWVVSNDTQVEVGVDQISFKRFTVNATDSLDDVSSYLTLRSEKGYPLTNTELDNNFKYLGNALDNKVDNSEYSAVAIIDKINSLSYTEAGISAYTLRGLEPSVTVPLDEVQTIPIRDEEGNITTDVFIGDLQGTAEKLLKGGEGRFGSYFTNMNNVDAGTLPVVHGGTGANTAAGARNNLFVVHRGGDSMTGKLYFKSSESGGAYVNIPVGQVPTSFEEGDIWTSGQYIYYRLNNSTEQVARVNTPVFTGEPKVNFTVEPQINSSGVITGNVQVIPTVNVINNLKSSYIDPQLNLKAPKESPTFTGIPTISTTDAEVTENGSRIPTTRWVQSVKNDFLQNTIQPVYETKVVVATKAPIVNPTFTGYARINYTGLPEPANETNILATTEWVQTVRNDLLNNTIVPNYATYNYVNTSARWMGSNKFISSSLPTSSDGVVGDIWIQTTSALVAAPENDSEYLRRDGTLPMTGFLTLHSDPNSDLHAVTKRYVDSEISGLSLSTGYVKVDGTVAMTAPLTLSSSAPTNAQHAVSKGYLETALSTLDLTGTYINASGDTMTGFLTLFNSAPENNLHATSKGYVDTSISTAINALEVDNTFVKLAGSTMTGALTLINSNPTNDNHAARKKYVDDSISALQSSYLSLSGGTLTGHLTLTSSAPTNDNHAISKGYLDTRIANLDISGSFVNANGDTMTGALTLPNSNPTNDNHAARKKYVDDSVSSAVTTLNTTIGGLGSTYVNTSGDTMTGFLTLHAAPTSNQHAATKAYVDAQIATAATETYVDNKDALKVNKSGDTMTGALTLPNSNPTNDNHAARKKYVDDLVSSTITNTATVSYVNEQDALKVSKSGDTMTGFLTLHAAPTSNQHAATKAYVDARYQPGYYYLIKNGVGAAATYSSIVGGFDYNKNYFDVFPPSGYTMSNLAAFICSPNKIYFSGKVNGDDILLCDYAFRSDRIRVFIGNSEQRNPGLANWMAAWIKYVTSSSYEGEGGETGGGGGGGGF